MQWSDVLSGWRQEAPLPFCSVPVGRGLCPKHPVNPYPPASLPAFWIDLRPLREESYWLQSLFCPHPLKGPAAHEML